MSDSQQVPLVIYKNGKRNVIGKAIVEKDGKITAQIAKDHIKDVQEFFLPKLGDFSLNPKHE